MKKHTIYILLLSLVAMLAQYSASQTITYETIGSLYDGMLQGYNKNIRPGQHIVPVKVGITIHVLSISKVDDAAQEFHWDMYFRQFWNDERLSFENKGAPAKVDKLASAVLKTKVWVPDPFFANQKEGHVLDNPADNTLFRISRNGDVLYSSRQLVRTSCPMDLRNYPFDTQQCSLEIESFAHTTNDINYYWREGNSSVTLNADLQVPNFKLEKMELKTTLAKTNTGEYDRLFATFVVKRNIGGFLYRSAIPAAIVMVISWMGFWLDPVNDCGPRFLIIGLSMLATLVLGSVSTSHLNVSYMTQAHSFFLNCLIFMIVNVVVTILLLVIGRNNKQVDEDNRCQTLCLNKLSWLDSLCRAVYLPIFFIYYAVYIAG